MIALRETGQLLNDDATLEGVECYWKMIDDTLSVWFEGTNHDDDWKYNLDVRIKNGSHSGYHRAFSRILNKLDELFDRELPKKLYFSGHSMGAGVARIAAEFFTLMHPFIPISLVTYGAPRSCTRKNRIILGMNNVVEYQHRGDLIPLIPIFWFSHLRRPVRIGKFSFRFHDNHQIAAYKDAGCE